MKKKKLTNRKILFNVASWVIFGIGIILVGVDVYHLIIGKTLSSNFVAGMTLIYEGLKISLGKIPKKE